MSDISVSIDIEPNPVDLTEAVPAVTDIAMIDVDIKRLHTQYRRGEIPRVRWHTKTSVLYDHRQRKIGELIKSGAIGPQQLTRLLPP